LATWLTYYIAIDYLVGMALAIFIIGAALLVVAIAVPAKAILCGKST